MRAFPFDIDYKGKTQVPSPNHGVDVCYFYKIKVKQQARRTINHHILIVNCSATMSIYLEEMKKNVYETLELLRKERGNYVSVIVYGGVQGAKTIISGMTCNQSAYEMANIYEVIEAAINPQEGCLLSAALTLALELVKKLEHLCDGHYITLFTDSFLAPMQWTVQEEERKSLALARLCHQKEVGFYIINFGIYSDPIFLKKLIGNQGATCLIHKEKMKLFKPYMREVIKQNMGRRPYGLYVENKRYFLCETQQFYEENALIKAFSERIPLLLVTYNEPLKVKGKMIKIGKREENKPVDEMSHLQFLYNLGAYYLRENEIEAAEHTIALTGDKAAYEAVCDSYSKCEKAMLYQHLMDLAQHANKRYRRGKETIEAKNIERDKLCLLEVLDLILNDPTSKLLWDYSYPYKRIGMKYSACHNGYRFIKPQVGYGEIEAVTIGSKKLNIGVRVKVIGQVEELKTHLKLDAYVYREYNLVVNGNLNTHTLVCTLSKPLKRQLRSQKLIKTSYKQGNEEICILDLNRLKVVNKKMLHLLKEDDIARYLYDIEVLKIKQWALKKLIAQIDKTEGDLEEECDVLTKTQAKLYQRFGLNEKGFYEGGEKEREKERPINTYKAEVVEWKIDHFPKKKVQTEVLAMYEEILDINPSKRLLQLKDELKEVRLERASKNSKLQLTRIACAMTKQAPVVWSQRIVKPKRETISELGENGVIGEQVEISTKVYRDCVLRQDCYTLRVVYHND